MLITLHPVPRIGRPLDDVMRSALGTATTTNAFSPAIDVITSEDGIEISCDLPGTRREDLDITVESRTLTVRSARRFDSDQGEQVLLGRSYGGFTRAFTLSDDVDADRLGAELAEGVLTIRIPTRPQPAPKKIQIGSPSEPKRMEARGAAQY